MTSPLAIHVIADSSGETAARIARAAQAQFPGILFTIVRHPSVKNADGLLGVFDDITRSLEDQPSVIGLFTLVRPEMAQMVERYCQDKQLPHANLFTRVFEAFEQATGTAPIRRWRGQLAWRRTISTGSPPWSSPSATTMGSWGWPVRVRHLPRGCLALRQDPAVVVSRLRGVQDGQRSADAGHRPAARTV